MTATRFPVTPDVTPTRSYESVDYVGKLRAAIGRPIEATWLPTQPLVACDDNHALLTAMKIAFYDHYPLRLSPDSIWITLARGFALHVQEHAEELRDRFVDHQGKEQIEIRRMDFEPGRENPWPEVFEEFSQQLAIRTKGMSDLVQADFSTTGTVERAVSHLMAMDTCQAYFEHVLYCGCGIPHITLTGTIEDWKAVRKRAKRFSKFGLKHWLAALDPILAQFVKAKQGREDTEFWKSMFRYQSGSGPSVMTGWANVLFPYLKDFQTDQLYPNPYLQDWQRRLNIASLQNVGDRVFNPQGVGMKAIPSCFTSVPLSLYWGKQKAEMLLIGGLMGVSIDEDSQEVRPDCGWVVAYDTPIETTHPK